MTTVNMHEAKTQPSKLVERAERDEPVIVVRAGEPVVRVTALDAPAAPRRLGFMAGEIEVPDVFNTMGVAGISALFGRSS